LLKKCREELDSLKVFKKHGVTKHCLLEFLRRIVVPKVNYAAFYDDESMEETYHEIDSEIAAFMRELISFKPSI